MAGRRDWRSIIFVAAAFFGLLVVWRDLRYDFNFASDMHKAELARRTAEVTETLVQTSVELQTSVVTEILKVPEKPQGERASAAFVILTRNKDWKELRESLMQLEDRFNRRYHYPYVFLNNEEFSDEFKSRISAVISGEAEFGLIPTEHWSYPDFINQTKAAEARQDMMQRKVIYGGHESYRHMCRYESGFFFRHPLMDKYKWYWRVEPGVKFGCDIDYDPFLFMQKNDKKYGFTISIKEVVETIPTLWDTTMKFMDENKAMIPSTNLMDFVKNKDGGYTRCHVWSTFEIGSLDFLRSERYLKYFDYLDHAGGEVHWFEDIGYYHGPLWNCPKGKANAKCWCPEEESIEIKNKGWSCTLDFVALPDPPKP
ncbi:alpha 1,2-mannosyltransferase 2.4.1 [Coemansia sp. Benny D115]|nr:alpha 1,2-mannosyltransferase 2.4.1 [Coemansia sp. Benny D115]